MKGLPALAIFLTNFLSSRCLVETVVPHFNNSSSLTKSSSYNIIKIFDTLSTNDGYDNPINLSKPPKNSFSCLDEVINFFNKPLCTFNSDSIVSSNKHCTNTVMVLGLSTIDKSAAFLPPFLSSMDKPSNSCALFAMASSDMSTAQSSSLTGPASGNSCSSALNLAANSSSSDSSSSNVVSGPKLLEFRLVPEAKSAMVTPPPTTFADAVADFLEFLPLALSGGFFKIKVANLCLGSITVLLPQALQSLVNESSLPTKISVSGFLQDPHKTNALMKPSNKSCNFRESCCPLTKNASSLV